MEHTRHGYWLEEAGAVAPAPPLDGDRDADVVVIGGGFTGLWAAWHLKELEPEARVVVLEADGCGRGPSGRNGGFCNAMWFSLASMRRRWGDEPALAVARAAQEGVDGIAAFCEEEGVDAWFRRAGYMQVSTAAAHDATVARALDACRELGVEGEVRRLSEAEVRARCDSPLFRAGAISVGGATVQPARLALGLRERLLARGVELFESSPVRSLRDGARRGRGTDPGRDGARPRRRAGDRRRRQEPARPAAQPPQRRLLPRRHHRAGARAAGARSAGPAASASPTPAPWSTTSAPPRTGASSSAGAAGGSRWGLGWAAAPELDPAVVAAAAEHLHAFFPGLAGTAITHAWGGPIDASPTHLPLVLPLAGGHAFVAAGYTGNGVGPSHMVGRTLASLALDRRDEHSRLAFVDPSPPLVPPEPFQWIGGEAIRAGIIAKENAELAGRTPSRVASALAAVPKLIGFHIGR